MMGESSYALLPRLAHPISVIDEVPPEVGYRFFLSYDGRTGHAILLHKSGEFLTAVRIDEYQPKRSSSPGGMNNNLEIALFAHGGSRAFRNLSVNDPVPSGAIAAFRKAINSASARILIQSVMIDIARAAQEDMIMFMIKFLNKADLNVQCQRNKDDLIVTHNGRKIISVYAPIANPKLEKK